MIPMKGACVFIDRWSLDELAYGVLSEGPYQTNLPSPDDIISYIREDREGQVTRIRHKEEIKKIKLTIIPPKQLFVDLTNDDERLTTPFPTTTSSSLTPPNASSKTPSTNDTSPSQDTTPSSFQSKLQISLPSSNEQSSPQPLNPLLDNMLDVPPRPLNPQPLQSHYSLDITLSLSSFENLKTPSPPSPPQPQPPIMGHPLYYNYHDYHRSTCICFSHN
ncbi:hypothetical protein Tco_1395341 [Tanacetum coccineum]